MIRAWYRFWWRIGRWIGYHMPDKPYRIAWFFMITDWQLRGFDWDKEFQKELEEYGQQPVRRE